GEHVEQDGADGGELVDGHAVAGVAATHRGQGRHELVGPVVVGGQRDDGLEQLVALGGHVGREHRSDVRVGGEQLAVEVVDELGCGRADRGEGDDQEPVVGLVLRRRVGRIRWGVWAGHGVLLGVDVYVNVHLAYPPVYSR